MPYTGICIIQIINYIQYFLDDIDKSYETNFLPSITECLKTNIWIDMKYQRENLRKNLRDAPLLPKGFPIKWNVTCTLQYLQYNNIEG